MREHCAITYDFYFILANSVIASLKYIILENAFAHSTTTTTCIYYLIKYLKPSCKYAVFTCAFGINFWELDSTYLLFCRFILFWRENMHVFHFSISHTTKKQLYNIISRVSLFFNIFIFTIYDNDFVIYIPSFKPQKHNTYGFITFPQHPLDCTKWKQKKKSYASPFISTWFRSNDAINKSHWGEHDHY